MTLKLSLDKQLAEQAQQVAINRGLSLDQLIRSLLEDLIAKPSAEEDMAELRRLSGFGDSQGWRFNREEVHERP